MAMPTPRQRERSRGISKPFSHRVKGVFVDIEVHECKVYIVAEQFVRICGKLCITYIYLPHLSLGVAGLELDWSSLTPWINVEEVD